MKDLGEMVFEQAAEIHGVQSAGEPEAFVGVAEAAEFLGYTTAWVKRLSKQGRIPHHQPRPYAHYRFLLSELRAWLRGEWEPLK